MLIVLLYRCFGTIQHQSPHWLAAGMFGTHVVLPKEQSPNHAAMTDMHRGAYMSSAQMVAVVILR